MLNWWNRPVEIHTCLCFTETEAWSHNYCKHKQSTCDLVASGNGCSEIIMWNLFVAINSDKSAKIANLLQSVANLLPSTYTEIHIKQKFTCSHSESDQSLICSSGCKCLETGCICSGNWSPVDWGCCIFKLREISWLQSDSDGKKIPRTQTQWLRNHSGVLFLLKWDRAISCVVTVKEQSIRGRCTVQLPGKRSLFKPYLETQS